LGKIVVVDKQTTGRRHARIVCRGEYATPKLKVFGPVGALTQAGSMGGRESAPAGPMDML